MRGWVVETFGARDRCDCANSRIDASRVSSCAIVPRWTLGSALSQRIIVAIEAWVTLFAIILVVQILVGANPAAIWLIVERSSDLVWGEIAGWGRILVRN